MRAFMYLLLFINLAIPSLAQDNLWKDVSKSEVISLEKNKKIASISQYRLVSVEPEALKEILRQAPLQFSKDAQNRTVTLPLPMPDGTIQEFEIQNAPIMHPDLASRYPEIQTYIGKGIDDPTATARLDFTTKGFHAQIISEKEGTILIDPLKEEQLDVYISFNKKNYADGVSNFKCYNPNIPHTVVQEKSQQFYAGDCQLRRYRLALACTGEYAVFHDPPNPPTVPTPRTAVVLSAMMTTMNRVNGIYERDLAITLQLVPNTDQLIFLDGTTDPYTNGDTDAMVNENQTQCDSRIGNANYDIGHVFGTNSGGFGPGDVCSSEKARGVTGSGSPRGDAFDVDYVAHEMGHQFGASHTFNNTCSDQRTDATAFEPGSGSTIMGYAGICNPNVQNNSDAYFHAISLQQIGNFVTTGTGSTCGVILPFTNNAPTVNAGLDRTIPIRTPFRLTANGSDPNGDFLTYCWEQMDNQISPMPPPSTNTGGPMFRSLNPSGSPTRFFPKLDTIINNTTSVWEVLPSVARTMNFRVTARDNRVGGGCTAEDNMVVTVDATTGPFRVTFPNAPACLIAGSTATITWDVAGTTGGMINEANVNILLSVDGGFTYPITLANNVPNDGSQDVVIPQLRSDEARIMVAAANNVFFDISDANFNIDCPDVLVVTDNPAVGIYKAKTRIETSGTVVVLSSATFLAGEEIILKPGFTAARGSQFIGRIEPCNTCSPVGALLADSAQKRHQDKVSDEVPLYTFGQKDIEGSKGSSAPLTIFPNPFRDVFTIQFETNQAGPVIIQLMDFSGKMIKEIHKTNYAAAGFYTFDVSTAALPAGVYYCVMSGSSGTKQSKLIKIAQ